jgi:hypothetical protein
MLHRVQVITTVSTLPLSKGIFSAKSPMNSKYWEAERGRRAIARSFREGSSPVTCRAFDE